MATLKTKFSVGLFLILGVTILIIVVIWLGMSNYLEKGRYFVAYFNESVQGLDVDSPVKYRGVHIGRVHSIKVAPDDRLIEVVLKIETDITSEEDAGNLVATLKSVGITGLMFIELEQKADEPPQPPQKFSFKPEYPVIATRPSEISKFFRGIDDIFNMIRAIDTRTISNQLVMVLEKVNHTIDEAKIASLMTDLRQTVQNAQRMLNSEKMNQLLVSVDQTSRNFDRLAINADSGVKEIRTTISRLDNLMQNGGADLLSITTDMKTAAQEVRRTMESATALLQGTDHKVGTLQRQAMTTLDRIEQAAASLNRLLEQLANQPSQVIFSAPAVDKP